MRHNIKVPNMSPPTGGSIDYPYNSIVMNMPNGKIMKIIKNTVSSDCTELVCRIYNENEEIISQSSIETFSNGILFSKHNGKPELTNSPSKFSMSMDGFKRAQDD